MTLKEQAQRTIKKYGMLDHVGNVVVGVSGGADSMALLHILLSLSREAPGPRILAAHVQHHLRGAEAREDEAYVRHICKEWGVPLFVHEEDIAALAERRKTGLEETGRQVRYAYLEEIAARHAPCRIATAHNRKDNMETVLLHLTRGCGLKGAAGIPPVRGAIIRPLLFCAREDIEAYCREQGIVYRQDSTNGDVAYSRNRIRREVLPSLTQINTGAEEAFLRFSLAARQDDDCLRELAVALVETAKTEKHSYNTASLLAAHPAIRSRALAEIVRREGGGVCEARHIDWLEKLLGRGGFQTLPSRLTVCVRRGQLCFLSESLERGDGAFPDAIPVMPGQDYEFCGKTCSFSILSLEEYDKEKKVNKNLLKNTVDYAMINHSLSLRCRQSGDRYRPVGRPTKTLKQLFNEAGIPVWERPLVPVLCDEAGILWVAGFGCAARAAVSESTRQILQITVKQEVNRTE